MNIHDAIEEYLGSKHNSITHSTYRWYALFLRYFEDFCKEQHPTDLSQITAVRVQQFVSSAKTTNTNTRHHRAQIVKGFLNWCSQDDATGVREKTVKRIEMPKTVQPEIEIITAKEFDKLLAVCEKTRNTLRNKALLYVLYDTGIRASELCYDTERPEEETGLRTENLILGRGTDSFLRVAGKGWKGRTIGFGHETSMALRRYLNRARRHAGSPFVFLSRNGKPLTVRTLEKVLQELGDLAGVADVHPHRFRHSFSIQQLMAGTSSLVLKELLGHESLESTRIYTRALTQMQAVKASISVVDNLRKNPKKR